MEVYELPNNTKAATGYTHKVVLTHEDLTTTTANTAQTIALLSVEAGDVVHSAAWKMVTSFQDASDSAYNTTTFIIGDDGSTNRFLSSTEANENGTEVYYKAHTNTAPYAYTAANTIDAVVGSMVAKSLSDIDAGEVHIFLGVNKLTDL
jgi:hypothetical protein